MIVRLRSWLRARLIAWSLATRSVITECTTAAAPREPHFALSPATTVTAGDGILQTDGTLWSHAATLGTRVKGDEFALDQDTLNSFVKNFSTGYPQKVPVDYEHASTSNDPEIRKLRAEGKVPKAGDVLELQAITDAAQFSGALKAAAEKLSALAGRELADPRNLGLWMRWRPTQKALQRVKDGEMTELSIAFDDDWPDNTTGAGQGPTLLAVALVNRPFLDDMLPVAASQTERPNAHGGTPAAPAQREEHMSQSLKLLAALTAVLAKPVETEDQGVTELAALQPEIKRLRDYSSVVAAEIGETDPVKAATKVKELKSAVAAAEEKEKAAKKTALEAQVETTLKEYEGRIGTKPLRELMGAQLRAELEAGTKLEDTKTLAALKSLPAAGNQGRASGADNGTNADQAGEKTIVRARELMASDKEIQALEQRSGFSAAWREANKRAQKELGAAS